MHIRPYIRRFILSPKVARLTPPFLRGVYLRLWYRVVTGRTLNLRHPRRFTEKIQWMKIHPERQWTRLADKVAVREYVAEKIGDGYLTPLVGNNGGVWKHPEDIDFSTLPDSFVLKCNHGSGYNIIVPDKSKMDKGAVVQELRKWMKEDFAYKHGLELHYSAIPRRILAEKYLPLDRAGVEIQAYTFGGKVRYISYESCKACEQTQRCVVDPQWNPAGFRISPSSYAAFEVLPAKPDFLDEFLQIAEKLAEGLIHARIDFAVCEGKLIFREITFTSGSGLSRYEPISADFSVGCMLQLPTES